MGIERSIDGKVLIEVHFLKEVHSIFACRCKLLARGSLPGRRGSYAEAMNKVFEFDAVGAHDRCTVEHSER